MDSLNIENFKPLFDNIIIKPIKIEHVGSGSLNLVKPLNEEDKAELGEVVSIPLSITEKNYQPIKVGDIVLFNKYCTTSIDFGKELILKVEDIVAVMSNK